MPNHQLNQYVSKLLSGYRLGRKEICFLLSLKDGDEIESLFKAARAVRQRHFGNRIFLYGFLYFSTYCRNNCGFCRYRRSNHALFRYRKTPAQILAAAEKMAGAGVHLIDLTMGEDPCLYESGFQPLIETARSVRDSTNRPVMISPGVVTDRTVDDMAAAGIEWFACYQETHNRKLFSRLRPGQSFDERMARKIRARKNGMLIEEGILTGVGECPEDLAESILKMRDFPAGQVRVMTFVPQPGTPLEGMIPRSSLQECIIISIMRLLMPDRLIPASLDVEGLEGLQARLAAGANVVTSIVPPEKGLAGVARRSLDIEDSRRSLGYVQKVLATCGLETARPLEYRDWLERYNAHCDRSKLNHHETQAAIHQPIPSN